ncbi:hypothetical protein QOT17_010604 [Balamuthia mandrillaris]
MMIRARRQMLREKLLSLEKMMLKQKLLSSSKLRDIALFALSNAQHAKLIAGVIAEFIDDCEEGAASAGYYVVDIICRKDETHAEKPRLQYARISYVLAFEERLPETFEITFPKVMRRPDIEQQILKLINQWQEHNVFSQSAISRFIKPYNGRSELVNSLPRVNSVKDFTSLLLKRRNHCNNNEGDEDTPQKKKEKDEDESNEENRETKKKANTLPTSQVRLVRSCSGFFEQLTHNAPSFAGLAEPLTPRGAKPPSASRELLPIPE